MRLEKLKGSGKFIHPLKVKRNAGTVKDKNGKLVPNWVTFAEPFGRVMYLSGDDAVVVHQRRPTATHSVELRALAGLDEEMRIEFRGRDLHIEEVSDPNNGEIRVLCHEAK